MNFGKIKSLSKKKKYYLVFGLVVLILIVVSGYVYYSSRQKSSGTINSVNKAGVSPKDAEERQKNSSDVLIFNKKYELYQMSRIGLSTQYVQNEDYDNADRVMKETVKNVPEDKVIAQTYMALWEVADKKKDTENSKKYAKKVVEILQKNNGDKDEIKLWQKNM